MMPTIGRIVHLHLPAPDQVNGADIAPAIVTRVWSRSDGLMPLINVKAFMDTPNVVNWYGSVPYREQAGENYYGATWSWPPREG
jgi:hypothetical protein